MKRRDQFIWGAIFAAVAAFVLFARRPAESAAEAFVGEPQLIAATFNSQWCSACKILKPRLLKVIPSFAGLPVKFVEYDLSFGPGTAREIAEADGLASVFDRFSKATGYTLLIDADTGEIIDMLTIRHDAGAMRVAIARALDRAQHQGG